MRDQEQFLQVLDRDEAERRFRAALNLSPLGVEPVPLDAALGRVLAVDVVSPVDVPSFDRSNVDGFAVIASDTFGASEEAPRVITLAQEAVHTGSVPKTTVRPGLSVAIATGGMVPRGADAVVMVEHVYVGSGDLHAAHPDAIHITRAVSAGTGISFAGTDITAGEAVARRGQTLTSRDTGVLAAVGVADVDVWRRPVVAILSTGNEIIAPGTPMRPGLVFDSNAQVLADAVREAGGEPLRLGIAADDLATLRAHVTEALRRADVVLLSGGTSKGAGDVSYRVVAELADPGIVAHGVALKPGKPICLAATGGKPVVVLPGFPTSAIFTFHEFVAPVLRQLAGRSTESATTVAARLAVRVNSEIGRTEYLLVGLVPSPDGEGEGALAAYPMGQGSGSVTTFSRADGFATIGRHEEIVPAGTAIDVQLLGRDLQLADLVVIGSHCVGLDYLLGELQQRGVRTKFIAVGSTGGLDAAKRGECDLAGVHLLDAVTGEYNRSSLTPALELLTGYGRLQGVVFRPGDQRFEGRDASDAVADAMADPECVMVNRNHGSGTRVLIDRLLHRASPSERRADPSGPAERLAGPLGAAERRAGPLGAAERRAGPFGPAIPAAPPGYAVQPRNHHAVAAAVAQGRADWGVTLETVARHAGLGFLPVQAEHYDFIVPRARSARAGVMAFREVLAEPATRDALSRLGMTLTT